MLKICIWNDSLLYPLIMHSLFTNFKIAIPNSQYTKQTMIAYSCSSTDLVESIKYFIQDKTGIPLESIALSIYGRSLLDKSSLFDKSVLYPAVVTVVISSP